MKLVNRATFCTLDLQCFPGCLWTEGGTISERETRGGNPSEGENKEATKYRISLLYH